MDKVWGGGKTLSPFFVDKILGFFYEPLHYIFCNFVMFCKHFFPNASSTLLKALISEIVNPVEKETAATVSVPT